MNISNEQVKALKAVIFATKKEHLGSLIDSGVIETLGITKSDYLASLDEDVKNEIVRHCVERDLLIQEVFSDKAYLSSLIYSVSQDDCDLLLDILKHKSAPEWLLIEAAKDSPMISVILLVAKLNMQSVNEFLYALPTSELDQVVIDVLLTYGNSDFIKKIESSK
ncbi:hypothetical protein LMH73_013850 [Vibrio splendidus]|nr:hypothetical protein [Vibrio splendidus]MCC4883065.1 hypothetical protein [Vibrio splendidus]